MKVSLLDYTGAGQTSPADYAAAMLIFAKSTRLEMRPGLLAEILAMPHAAKRKELAYIANTIPSSWEFCDYTFMIEDVTRGFTHQFVRTRTASFAQQTMRVLDVKGWGYGTGPSIEAADDLTRGVYSETMNQIDLAYRAMIERGVKIEDARGVLPTNIHTNILVKMNLRTFVDMVRKRSSSRVQGEYRDVLNLMKLAVLEIHPWAELFINRTFDQAASDLDREISAEPDHERRLRMIKLLDQMRTTEG